jgi:spore coat protein X
MNQEIYRASTANKETKWSALDPSMDHPVFHCDDNETQGAVQKTNEFQLSEELIFIKDSCDISVSTTDTKAAINLQVALQAAIVVLLQVSIADSAKAEKVAQDLLQSAKISQISRQKTVIENSRNVNITTTDTQVAVNIQLLIQILVALLVRLDIL